MSGLFETLSERLKTKQNIVPNEKYLNDLKYCLNVLNYEQAEQVTVLIIHYYLKSHPNLFTPENINSSFKTGKLPYNIKCRPGIKALSFCLDNMEQELKILLGEYCLLN